MLHSRISRPLLVPLAFLGIFAAGCNRSSGPDLTADVQRLTSELEAANLKIDTLEKTRVTKQQDIAISTTADATKNPPPAPAPGGTQKDAQIAALQTELAELKKRDVFAFATASAAVQANGGSTALNRYQQFLTDFPNSSLAADADRAIAELTTAKEREARARALVIDPRAPEREILQHFNDGTVTVKEIGPLLKNRSSAEVVKLLGPPTQTFRDGKELGYTDKVIDTATGGKVTLVIGFEADVVSTLRIGYLGKPVKP